jgi:hypothetical protein
VAFAQEFIYLTSRHLKVSFLRRRSSSDSLVDSWLESTCSCSADKSTSAESTAIQNKKQDILGTDRILGNFHPAHYSCALIT